MASATESICDLLSLSVISLCFVVKFPQIWIIFKSRDTRSLSFESVLLEQCGYSIMLSYSFAMDYPLSTYFEYTFLVLQDMVLIMLMLHTNDSFSWKLIPSFLLYFAVYTTIAYRLVPDAVLKFAMSLGTPLSIFSKSTQILTLYRRKDPGQLSLTTWAIVSYGCLARFFTTAVKTGDIFVLLNFGTGAALNLTVVSMIIYYGQRKRQKLY
ncbi:hypothetical protein CHS0354_022426 [Potamilus streckersoni]|uniref:Solute carrier family 66 member 3 n=1 Tax=Potamilus streckersoni TaxID=2493646 RepID=A0AAE0SY10_9BIVA|nr:hypothetical protein CHS0354_022426 [Potamilus streckersoni]